MNISIYKYKIICLRERIQDKQGPIDSPPLKYQGWTRAVQKRDRQSTGRQEELGRLTRAVRGRAGTGMEPDTVEGSRFISGMGMTKDNEGSAEQCRDNAGQS